MLVGVHNGVIEIVDDLPGVSAEQECVDGIETAFVKEDGVGAPCVFVKVSSFEKFLGQFGDFGANSGIGQHRQVHAYSLSETCAVGIICNNQELHIQVLA
jgi:hypothetical protein